MTQHVLRSVLRDGTGDLHATLDAQVGALDSPAAYLAYLRGSHAFRSAIDPLLEAGSARIGWRPVMLSDATARDLADLGAGRPPPVTPPALPDAASVAGALYVVEGSTIGAALIARRAAALGYTAGHGASHLALQTGDPRRWRRFLDWLHAADPDPARAVKAARAVFQTAMTAFTQR